MSELITRAKASLEGVTEGPWETRPGLDADPTTTSASVHSGHRSILVSSDGYHYGYADKADARFIAAARQLVPELIAEVEFLEPEVAHWKSMWKDTVEYADKVIQERDEALRVLEEIREKCLRWGCDHRLPQEVAVVAAPVIQCIGGLG
ncbi:hypothetical protein PROPHIGD54-2_11 [Mycobacterium phage prophiGD54-2]|uniref:hypothetical protein n=1 Tax=Mycobacteroides abscessus TaxID=36809 RepID=UPI0019CF7C69|nr:hypothetical protein [Mycobacteroides abscessus]QSM04611.1 hypothetical protein PROPHIGD54-2_11 [Mycobacterium phage prophiGD54-2]QSN23882.1 hypothetical protein I3U41_17380 [Mycobacteroides abscessus subsp. abscessus]